LAEADTVLGVVVSEVESAFGQALEHPSGKELLGDAGRSLRADVGSLGRGVHEEVTGRVKAPRGGNGAVGAGRNTSEVVVACTVLRAVRIERAAGGANTAVVVRVDWGTGAPGDALAGTVGEVGPAAAAVSIRNLATVLEAIAATLVDWRAAGGGSEADVVVAGSLAKAEIGDDRGEEVVDVLGVSRSGDGEAPHVSSASNHLTLERLLVGHLIVSQRAIETGVVSILDLVIRVAVLVPSEAGLAGHDWVRASAA